MFRFSFCQVTGLEKSSCICLSPTLVETLHSLWCTFSLQSCSQQLYGKHQRVFVPLEMNEYNEHLQWLHISVGRALQQYRKHHGFESRRGPVNFQVSIRDNCLNGPDKCADYVCLSSITRSSKGYLFHLIVLVLARALVRLTPASSVFFVPVLMLHLSASAVMPK